MNVQKASILLISLFVMVSCAEPSDGGQGDIKELGQETEDMSTIMDMSAMRDISPTVDMFVSDEADIQDVDQGEFGTDMLVTMRTCGSKPDRLLYPPQVQELKGCQVYLGNISVSDHPSNDVFEVLSELRVIEGDFQVIRYQNLANFNGLQKLTRIGGDVTFRFLASLMEMNLQELNTVDGELFIEGMRELESLQGLEKLESVGQLYISVNPNLTSLKGLEGLKEVNGDLRIDLNDKLPKSEVEDLLKRIKVSGTINVD